MCEWEQMLLQTLPILLRGRSLSIQHTEEPGN